MATNEKYLYLALYMTPGEDIHQKQRAYHWAYLVGPKSEIQTGDKQTSTEATSNPGIRYHATNDTPHKVWKYEAKLIDDIRVSPQILVRVLLAKVKDEDRLTAVFQAVEIKKDDPEFNCRVWTAAAWDSIVKDGWCVEVNVGGWSEIEKKAREFCEEKYRPGVVMTIADMMGPRPTYDLLAQKEIVP